MSRSVRTLATMVVVALSSWSCGSTAPDVTPKVGAIVVSPASSTITLNAQLPLQAEVRDDSGAVVSAAEISAAPISATPIPAAAQRRTGDRRARRHQSRNELVAGGRHAEPRRHA